MATLINPNPSFVSDDLSVQSQTSITMDKASDLNKDLSLPSSNVSSSTSTKGTRTASKPTSTANKKTTGAKGSKSKNTKDKKKPVAKAKSTTSEKPGTKKGDAKSNGNKSSVKGNGTKREGKSKTTGSKGKKASSGNDTKTDKAPTTGSESSNEGEIHEPTVEENETDVMIKKEDKGKAKYPETEDSKQALEEKVLEDEQEPVSDNKSIGNKTDDDEAGFSSDDVSVFKKYNTRSKNERKHSTHLDDRSYSKDPERGDNSSSEKRVEFPPLEQGTKVSKIFEVDDSFQVFTGTLVECGEVEGCSGPHWLVSYDDGEEEDLPAKEVEFLQRHEKDITEQVAKLNNIGEPEFALGTKLYQIFLDEKHYAETGARRFTKVEGELEAYGPVKSQYGYEICYTVSYKNGFTDHLNVNQVKYRLTGGFEKELQRVKEEMELEEEELKEEEKECKPYGDVSKKCSKTSKREFTFAGMDNGSDDDDDDYDVYPCKSKSSKKRKVAQDK